MSALTLDLTPVIQLTEGQFYDLCLKNPEVRLERTAIGALLIMPPTGGETGRRNSDLITELTLWNRQAQLGVVFDSSTGFILPNSAIRSPDVAWVLSKRWQALSSEQRQRFLPLCPDFLVELLSPSDRWEDGFLKLQEYQANGARLSWLIDPNRRRVAIFREGGAIEILETPTCLQGEAVLPGFVLPLSLLWGTP